MTTIKRAELLQRRSWRGCEAFVATRSITARFFFGLVLVIALARLLGCVQWVILAGRLPSSLSVFLFFAAGSIANGLSLSGLLSEFGGPIFQVGLCALPPSSVSLAIVTAVAIHVMIRRERTIAPLEQTLSGRKSEWCPLRLGPRAMILKLGQGGAITPRRSSLTVGVATPR